MFEFDFFFDESRLRIEDFGSRVVFERRKVNSSNENILILQDLQLPQNPPTCMQNAVNRIVSYLSNSDPAPLLGTRLQDIGPTLNSLWSAFSFNETSQPN